jgi:C4-dicarboxylate-specific signal transduction histidine kinase
MVNEALTLVRSRVESYRVSVRTELAPELPQVLADRIQLQQVILNLIVNGIEAMSSLNGRARVLHLRSEAVEPIGVMVTVKDTGVGIDPDKIDRIFEPFFTTKTHGMGLGLSICRSIVEAHGGRLVVTHGDPHGSAFQVVLPGNRR